MKQYLFLKAKKLKCIVLFFVFILMGLNTPSNVNKEHQNSKFPIKVVAYFRGNIDEINNYDYTKISHLIYCFMYLKGNKLSFKNEDSENTLKACLSLKKKYPHLKVLIALGGWGGCETCSDVFSTEKGRAEFALSVKDILIKYNADGIDIDWESPVIGGFKDHKSSPNDKVNFTALIFELRKKLKQQYEICFDANAFKEYIDQSIEWQKVMPKVDFFNLMTYGMPANKRGYTGHHSALYSSSYQTESIDKSIRYLDSLKIPLNKIVIGAAFYSFVVQEVDSVNQGLGQKGKFKANVNYKQIVENYTVQNGYNYYWDSIAKAPYLYNAKERIFVTYDDIRSVGLKTDYAIQKKLGGIMFWKLNGDTSTDGLLNSIYSHLNTSYK